MEDTEETIGFIADKGGEHVLKDDSQSLSELVDGIGDVAYEVSYNACYLDYGTSFYSPEAFVLMN